MDFGGSRGTESTAFWQGSQGDVPGLPLAAESHGLGVPGTLSGGVWMPLDGVDEGNGTIAVLPGWHTSGALSTNARPGGESCFGAHGQATVNAVPPAPPKRKRGDRSLRAFKESSSIRFLFFRTCCRRYPGPGSRCRHCRIPHPDTSRGKCCRPIRWWRPSRWHRRNPGSH